MEITQGLRDCSSSIPMHKAPDNYQATWRILGAAAIYAGAPAFAHAQDAFGALSFHPIATATTSAILAPDPLWLALATAMVALAGLALYAGRLRRRLVRETRARARAQHQARRLAGALDQTGEMVMITDADGSIEYVNQAFTRLTGYTAEEVRGRTPAILRSGQHNTEFYGRLWGTIRRGKAFQDDIINRRKDGTLFYSCVSILPIRDPVGNSTYFVATVGDVTQQRLVEEETRKRDEQLAHTARLNIIGEMVANLAHELSQPLTAIINYAHGCVRRALAPDTKPMQLVEPLKQIVVQGQRTAAVVQHLREFVASREPRRASADLNQLVAQAASLEIGRAHV